MPEFRDGRWHLTWMVPTMKPYDVQVAFMKAMSDKIFVEGKKGWGNWKEPGLGKTLDAYNLFLNLNALPKTHPMWVEKMVVFMPNFGKGNWGSEINDEDKMNMHDPTVLSPNVAMPTGPRIWEINYDIARYALFDQIEKFMLQYRTMFVADEAHNIKKYNGKTSKKIVALSKHAVFSMPMTGTPYGEDPLELWAQIRVARQINGVNPITFRNTHCLMGGFRGKQITGPKDPEGFSRLLNEWGFVGRADDWLDLPERIYRTANSVMLPAQQKLYDEMYHDRFLPMVEGRGEVTAEMIITMMIKLQQITSGFIIDNDRLTSMLMPIDQNPRIKTVAEICANSSGKKIIFTTSRFSTQALVEYLPNSISIQGGMKPDEIKEARNRFNSNGGPVHFIAPEQMAKEQITLLGSKTDKRWACHTTIYFENLYGINPRKQSEDRNRRIGQRWPVTYWDIAMSPFDRRQYADIQAKRSVVASVYRPLSGALSSDPDDPRDGLAES